MERSKRNLRLYSITINIGGMKYCFNYDKKEQILDTNEERANKIKNIKLMMNIQNLRNIENNNKYFSSNSNNNSKSSEEEENNNKNEPTKSEINNTTNETFYDLVNYDNSPNKSTKLIDNNKNVNNNTNNYNLNEDIITNDINQDDSFLNLETFYDADDNNDDQLILFEDSEISSIEEV